jgi:phosphogluconate dehydratase
MNQRILEVTKRIIERSKATRANYLDQMQSAYSDGVARQAMHCGNLAHAFAACGTTDKNNLSAEKVPNIGIITAYNDMLSAHKTYENYPAELRAYAQKHNAVAQVAGAVPAMCDGVTQGQSGMEEKRRIFDEKRSGLDAMRGQYQQLQLKQSK